MDFVLISLDLTIRLVYNSPDMTWKQVRIAGGDTNNGERLFCYGKPPLALAMPGPVPSLRRRGMLSSLLFVND
ncbi:MAG: hypothetical protein P8100_11175 [bacterium]